MTQGKKDPLQRAKDYQNDGRTWLFAGQADSYGNESNRAAFYVLQGSPPRGFIIALSDMSESVGLAIRLDGRGKRLRIFSRDEEKVAR